MANTSEILESIKTMEKFPLEVIYAKHLIMYVKNTAELDEFLKSEEAECFSSVTKNNLRNAFSDLKSGRYNAPDVPLLIIRK